MISRNNIKTTYDNFDMNDVKTGDPHSDIIECALRNDFDGVDNALQANTENINTQDFITEITALMAASGSGLHAMVDHLLSKPGINLDLRDSFGKDALDHARLFPKIVEKIMIARTPGRKWKEPKIGPAPS